MINSNLGLGPMSFEVIEAIFRNSHYKRRPLMIVVSKNQIDHSRGYINNWTTEEFMGFVNKMREKYPNSSVKICRDHCGPGFNGIYDLEDTYKTIESDIENDFDLIHIDFCHFRGEREEALEEAKKAIQYCLRLKPNILLEIGTDENVGIKFNLMNLEEIEKEIAFFTEFCKPEFYVVQTGSLVKEINQVGNFNKQFIEKVSEILKTKGIKLKEHNADYFSKEDIQARKFIVDALNVAPQLGVIQTMYVLKKCLIYGIDFKKFIEKVYHGERWRKWMWDNDEKNKFLCSIIAGHYHFADEEYKEIVRELEKREDIHENIIEKIMEVIDHYE